VSLDRVTTAATESTAYVALDSGSPCRSRGRGGQSDGDGVAAEDHQGDQPAGCLLAVGVEPEELGDVLDGCGVVLDPASLRGHAGALSGRATAANQVDAQLVKRSTADSAGSSTAVNLTAVPPSTARPALLSRPTRAPASTRPWALPLATSALSNPTCPLRAATPIEWDFGNLADKPVYLRSANEGLYLNFNGAVLPAGTILNIFVEWTEELVD
jgi:hypothetical protein